jgi:hypothetical protein
MNHVGLPPGSIPSRADRDNSQAVEEREELVGWLIAAGFAAGRSSAVERSLLQFKIGALWRRRISQLSEWLCCSFRISLSGVGSGVGVACGLGVVLELPVAVSA